VGKRERTNSERERGRDEQRVRKKNRMRNRVLNRGLDVVVLKKWLAKIGKVGSYFKIVGKNG